MEWATYVDASQLYPTRPPRGPEISPEGYRVPERFKDHVLEAPVAGGRCHWVIPGLLLAGSYPTPATLPDLLEAVRQCPNFCVVSLLEPREVSATTHASLTSQSVPNGTRVMTAAFPVRHGTPMDEEHAISFIDDIIERAACNGETVYVYSSEGKARAVALVSILVGVMYSLPADDAVAYVTECMRCPPSVLSGPQLTQVHSLLTKKRQEFCFYHNLLGDRMQYLRAHASADDVGSLAVGVSNAQKSPKHLRSSSDDDDDESSSSSGGSINGEI